MDDESGCDINPVKVVASNELVEEFLKINATEMASEFIKRGDVWKKKELPYKFSELKGMFEVHEFRQSKSKDTSSGNGKGSKREKEKPSLLVVKVESIQ